VHVVASGWTDRHDKRMFDSVAAAWPVLLHPVTDIVMVTLYLFDLIVKHSCTVSRAYRLAV
jgi:hypothetical protein